MARPSGKRERGSSAAEAPQEEYTQGLRSHGDWLSRHLRHVNRAIWPQTRNDGGHTAKCAKNASHWTYNLFALFIFLVTLILLSHYFLELFDVSRETLSRDS